MTTAAAPVAAPSEPTADEIIGAALPGFAEKHAANEEDDGETDSNDQEAEPEATEQATEEDGKQPEKADPLKLLRDDAGFDDKTLSTPEGIKNARRVLIDARTAVRKDADRNHATFVKLEARETRLNRGINEYNRRVKSFEAVESARNADVDMLLNGNGDEKLQALGRLAKRSGVDVYEELTAGMLGTKKAGKQKDPVIDELKSTVEQLKQTLTERQKEEQAKQHQEARQGWLNSVVSLANANLASLPGIRYQVEQNPANGDQLLEWVEQEHLSDVQAAKQGGGRVRTVEQLILEAEGELKKLVPADYGKPKVEKKKLPGTGRPLGAGVSPSRGSTSTGTREMTEEERFQELVSDPDILSKLRLA